MRNSLVIGVVLAGMLAQVQGQIIEAEGSAARKANRDVMAAPVSPGTIPTYGTIGDKVKTVHDRLDKVEKGSLKGVCVWFRDVKTQFDFKTEETKFIYYMIYQCLDADLKMIWQRVYFSFDENDQGEVLPAGCPPPTVEPPQKPDPCKNGFQVGDVISRVVSRVVVPKLVEDNDSNPLAQEPAFKDYVKLREEISRDPEHTTFEKFTEEQQKIIDKYAELLKAVADEKIKCFTEEVTPVKEMDIQFVCAKEGAFKTIAEALKAALGDQLTCQHIGCDQLQADLTKAMEHDPNAKVGATTEEAQVAPGEADVFGNVLSPLDGDTYLFVSKNSQLALGPDSTVAAGGFVELQSCSTDSSQQFIVVKTGAKDFFKIKSSIDNLYLTAAGLGADIIYAPLTQGEEQNWRFQNNIDGSVLIVNEKFGANLDVDGGLLIKGENISLQQASTFATQKFLVRKQCFNPIVPGKPMLSGNIALPLANSAYFMRSPFSKLAINDLASVVAGGRIAQNACGAHENQSWITIQNADGSWSFQSGESGLFITINQALEVVYDVLGKDKNQSFRISSNDLGQLTITSSLDKTSGLMLQSAIEGAAVVYGPIRGLPEELFTLNLNC